VRGTGSEPAGECWVNTWCHPVRARGAGLPGHL